TSAGSKKFTVRMFPPATKDPGDRWTLRLARIFRSGLDRVTCVTRLADARLVRTHELRWRVPVRRRAFAARQGARRWRPRAAQAARARPPAWRIARYAPRRRGLRTR